MKNGSELIPISLPENVIIYVESTIVGEEEVAFESISFKNITDVIEGVASAIAPTLRKVAPHKASVEFGLEITVKSGHLATVLVQGEGMAHLKVSMEWEKS